MKDVKPDRDARLISSLAGADESQGRRRGVADAQRRSRRLRALAVVVVVVGAVAFIVGPHFFDDTRLSSVADQAAENARGEAPAVSCPPTPIARDVVKPSSVVTLSAAVICHYRQGQGEIRPIEGPVPASQLSGIGADMNANTVSGPLSEVSGLSVRGATTEDWVVVAVTTHGERVQLLANRYPKVYIWDGLGPGLEWHPSMAVQRMLAADLPR